jgi:hypothetical protein
MKELTGRLVVSAGAILFAISFFLPVHSSRAPFSMLKWTIETASSMDTRFEFLAFAAVSAIIAYPYAWSAAVALAGLAGRSWPFTENRWLHLSFHAAGGLLTAAIGITLLALRETWIPVPAQWAAAAAPLVILALMIFSILLIRGNRSAWLVIALGFIPQAPLHLALARAASDFEEPAWGFIMGGASATLAIAGSLLMFFQPRTPPAIQQKLPLTPSSYPCTSNQ